MVSIDVFGTVRISVLRCSIYVFVHQCNDGSSFGVTITRIKPNMSHAERRSIIGCEMMDKIGLDFDVSMSMFTALEEFVCGPEDRK